MNNEFVIVSDQLFVFGERIHHMSIEENTEFRDFKPTPWWKFWVSKKDRKYKNDYEMFVRSWKLYIEYVPVPNATNNGRSRDHIEVHLEFQNKPDAVKAFNEIVKQYRDQNPDKLHLSKLVDDFLA